MKGLAMRFTPWVLSALVTIVVGACATPRGAGHAAKPISAAEAGKALTRAETAYIEGDFDQAMDETRPVLQGRAPAQERYRALKLRALAQCQSEEAPPPDELADRLMPSDRQAVLGICVTPL